MKIEACIFDLDGVVVDTAGYHYQAWSRLAEQLGFSFTKMDNERLKGVSRMRSLDILLEVGGMLGRHTDEQKLELATRKNEWYVELINKMTPAEILPGVIEFLEELEVSGVKIGLGSASRNTPTILERVALTERFEAVVDGNSVSKAKPDPEVFLLGAELLGVEPKNCVVFEDAEAGVEAAHRAGMKCVGIGSPEILGAAEIVIPNFKDLTLEKLRNKLNK